MHKGTLLGPNVEAGCQPRPGRAGAGRRLDCMAYLRCVAGVYDSKQVSDDQISCILGPHYVYDCTWPKTVVVTLVRSWTLVGQNKTTGSMVSLPLKKIVAIYIYMVVQNQ